MEWKQIKECAGYQISNTGEVRQVKKEKIYRNDINNKPYVILKDTFTGSSHQYCLENLVLEYFGYEKEKPFIVHKDGDIMNNNIDNLKYVDYDENDDIVQVSLKNLIEQRDLDGNVVDVFTSIEEASKKTGCSQTGIKDVLDGYKKFAGGYFWRRVKGSTTNLQG